MTVYFSIYRTALRDSSFRFASFGMTIDLFWYVKRRRFAGANRLLFTIITQNGCHSERQRGISRMRNSVSKKPDHCEEQRDESILITSAGIILIPLHHCTVNLCAA